MATGVQEQDGSEVLQVLLEDPDPEEALPALHHGTHVLRARHRHVGEGRWKTRSSSALLRTNRTRKLVLAIGSRRILLRLEGPDDARIGAARLLLAEGSLESLQAVSQMAGDPVQEVRWSAVTASNALEASRTRSGQRSEQLPRECCSWNARRRGSSPPR
jgi:HEAT repeat protein